RRTSRRALQIALTILLGLVVAFPAYASDADAAGTASSPAADAAKTTPAAGAGDIDAEKLFGAIVKVATRATPGARSADSLGEERGSTCVAIIDNGLVLTIGYLIVEADDVKVTDVKGRTLPAQ